MEPDSSKQDALMAKGMVFVIGLFVIAIPILLGAIMVRSFFASEEPDPSRQVPAIQAEGQNLQELPNAVDEQ